MDTYLTPEIHYFSLLRPLSELQIAGFFSTLTDYLPVFRSCNVGQKEERWCGHCAKCLFVCVMLSAYLPDETLRSIFGADMLNDETMKPLFLQLTGLEDDKPFECVGTREEVNTAAAMSIMSVTESRYQRCTSSIGKAPTMNITGIRRWIGISSMRNILCRKNIRHF